MQATGATARVAPANPDGHAMPLGHDLAAMAQLVNERTRVVFIANPNNPTGTWVECRSAARVHRALPTQTLVVVDEAYIEYVSEPDFPERSRWLAEFPNLVVMRTFSKAYGLAGLRVGYALVASGRRGYAESRAPAVQRQSVALAAALAALDDQEHLEQIARCQSRRLAQLRTGFDALGVTYLPSARQLRADRLRAARAGRLRGHAARGRDRPAGRQL